MIILYTFIPYTGENEKRKNERRRKQRKGKMKEGEMKEGEKVKERVGRRYNEGEVRTRKNL